MSSQLFCLLLPLHVPCFIPDLGSKTVLSAASVNVLPLYLMAQADQLSCLPLCLQLRDLLHLAGEEGEGCPLQQLLGLPAALLAKAAFYIPLLEKLPA